MTVELISMGVEKNLKAVGLLLERIHHPLAETLPNTIVKRAPVSAIE
jgi:hypothetical protein